MNTRIMCTAALAAAIALSTVRAAQAAEFVPDGTYQYAFKQGSTTIGASSVAIKRSGSVISIHENQTLTDAQLGAVQATSDESILADTLAPLSFAASYAASGKTVEVKLALSGGSGAFERDGERLTVPVRMLMGTQAMAVEDQALVTSFIVFPALTQNAKASAFTIAVPTAARTFIMRVDPMAATKPAGVPANDTSVSFASPVAFSIWYDPRTGVVDEIDVPSQSLVIALTKHT